MKIYFSVDPEVSGGESDVNLRKLMTFLQDEGHKLYRAEYVFATDPDLFLQKELGLNRKPTFREQREVHIKWIDESDLLLAEISAPSEGRSMVIQRAIDKPRMGLPYTPIIIIKGKKFDRRIGKIVRGLIESGEVVYYEYDKLEEVIENWPKLLKQSSSKT
ncbi:MAG: hypothetical protein WD231_00520 [Candidatus Woykebacteria bacterium]